MSSENENFESKESLDYNYYQDTMNRDKSKYSDTITIPCLVDSRDGTTADLVFQVKELILTSGVRFENVKWLTPITTIVGLRRNVIVNYDNKDYRIYIIPGEK